MQTINLIRATIGVILLSCASTALAEVNLITRSLQDVSVVDENGIETVQRVPATSVVPGDTVIYEITASNNGQEPANNILITNAVPEHMSYVRGSVESGGALVTFSVDGGENYDNEEALVVRKLDGSTRPARAGDYTHLRWKLDYALKPGQSATVSYQARLN